MQSRATCEGGHNLLIITNSRKDLFPKGLLPLWPHMWLKHAWPLPTGFFADTSLSCGGCVSALPRGLQSCLGPGHPPPAIISARDPPAAPTLCQPQLQRDPCTAPADTDLVPVLNLEPHSPCCPYPAMPGSPQANPPDTQAELGRRKGAAGQELCGWGCRGSCSPHTINFMLSRSAQIDLWTCFTVCHQED